MSELRAGDLVLDSKNSVTRVVVNQHVHSDSISHILYIQHEGGHLSITPDHMLFVDGDLRPARTITNGASLSGCKVHPVTSGRSGIINPITASGLILAASTSGQPILAATGSEWLADVMLSSYSQHTLSYALASAFPAIVQRFYDSVLEPVFNALVPTLTSIKALAPQSVVYATLISGNLILATAFGIYAMTISAATLCNGLALAASVRLLRCKQ